MPTAVPDGRQRGSRSDDRRRVRRREARPGDGHPAVARRQFLVTRGRAADVGSLRRRRSSARSSSVLATPRSRGHPVVLLTGRTSCRSPTVSTRTSSRGSPTSSTRTSSSGCARSRPSSSATCPARTGTRPGVTGATSTSDVWLVSRQAWFAAEIARRFGTHLAVTGWLVSNEMPLYGGPAPADVVAAWARTIVEAVRSTGAAQPISLGDGAWGLEVSGEDNGYSLRALAPLVDFVGPHSYPMQDDQLRQFLTPAFHCELAGGFGKPVVLEEFGVELRLRMRGERGRVLPAGPAHDIARRRARLAGLEQLRLRRHSRRGPVPSPRLRAPFRPHGLERTAEGAAARDGVVLRARARARRRRLEARQGRRGHRRARALRARPCRSRAPSTGRTSARTCSSHTSPHGRPTCPSSSSASATASAMAPGSTWRRARSSSPHPASTACGTWRTREPTVYLSYFAGSTPNQRGPWLSWLDEIFGVRHLLRYGLVDPIVDDEVVFALRRGPRRDHVRHTALVPGRRLAERPLVPAGRARRSRRRRRRRPWASRPRAAYARRRPDVPLYLSARAHGCQDSLGEPREHVANLFGACHCGRGLETRSGRRPASPCRLPGKRCRPARSSSSTPPRTSCRSNRSRPAAPFSAIPPGL